jgi:hypothetical protein
MGMASANGLEHLQLFTSVDAAPRVIRFRDSALDNRRLLVNPVEQQWERIPSQDLPHYRCAVLDTTLDFYFDERLLFSFLRSAGASEPGKLVRAQRLNFAGAGEKSSSCVR